MKLRLLLVALLVGAGIKTYAQVEDVSFFVTPTASYNWFSKKTTVEDGLMYGLQAGFGFGKFLELRGFYEQSSDLDQEFGHYVDKLEDLGLNWDLPGRDVRVKRIGGEFKANFANKAAVSPYLLVGTGVHKYSREFENETLKTENIYGSAGLGFKFNITNRLTFNLEGRAFGSNFNSNSLIVDPDQLGDTDYEDWLAGNKKVSVFNYSVNAGLQLYLGGTNDKDFSDLDRAYFKRFGSGLHGFKVTLAPAGAYVDFDRKSALNDTYLLGAELGLEFTDYIGIKAYYLRATEDEKIKFNFDELHMFGADFEGRLNVARGIVPFVTVGGGYLKVGDDYVAASANQTAESKYYAKGGLGLSIPLSKYVDLYGAANILVTTEDDESLSDIVVTDNLRNHKMYNVGLRIKLGKQVDTQGVVDATFESRFAPERRRYNESLEDYAKRMEAYNKEIEAYSEELEAKDELLAIYQLEVEELEAQLKQAFDENDEEKVVEIIKEKQVLEENYKKASEEVEKLSVPAKKQDNLIRMTPAELESLIDKVLNEVDKEEAEKTIDQRLDRLEQLLEQLNKGEPTGMKTRAVQPTEEVVEEVAVEYTPRVIDNSANDRLVEEIVKLQERVKEQDRQISNLRHRSLSTSEETRKLQKDINKGGKTRLVDNTTKTGSGSYFNEGLAVFLAPSFGDATNYNVGVRSYHSFSGTSILFVPDLYFGFGSRASFGLNANALIPVVQLDEFTPYAGLGLGLNYIDKSFKFAPNFIVGSSYQLGNGSSLFLDYTARGAFKNNQIALGYRFNF